MSIDASKSVTTISKLLNPKTISEQHKRQPATVTTKNSATSGTNVSLSQQTLTLLQTTEHDVNLDKVTQIKQAIAEGKLVVNSHKIADELIKQIQQDLGQ
ncbi:flagellar biosynthesis anti-sigma factor FlgM [Gilliamella sp. wkB112]|uniref:flagellar biosynthesis anti-sigma factor FlgM n=1 Tax=Gilliamella sp. wkB112 TaxID=3120257 RepID=UPI00080DEDBF|nr:flagellar biosynthesis anti-sigma factor FlgM [Gilliamella apicola]OCG05299.1 flagellar biosynthesis anti-sigma factor FlgM [Gilliamella apicola]